MLGNGAAWRRGERERERESVDVESVLFFLALNVYV